MKAADLKLDSASRRAWRAGREITLTNRYALLEFFLRNKNRVLTRTAIIQHVWDLSYDPMTNMSMRTSARFGRRSMGLLTAAHYDGARGRLHVGRTGRVGMKSFRGLVRHSTLVLIAGLILILSLLVYWGFDTLLHQYVDGRLFALAQTLGRLIQQRPDLVLLLDEELLSREEGAVRNEEESRQLREAAHSVHLLSSDGRVVWKGSEVVSRPPMEPAALEHVRRGETVYDTVRAMDGSSIRRVSFPIVSHGDLRYILQAETSLLFSQKALTGLTLLLMVVSVGILAMAWISSGWLARKVLGPVRALSATAATISEPDARHRFVLDAPYEEFQQLTHAFNAMMDRLQKSRESQGYFVDYAAHEMQTPLTVLQANLEVTLNKARTIEEYRDALINNLEQVERLVTLTRELLTLTRLAGDRTPVRRAPLELQSLLQELIDELRVLAEDHQIGLSLGPNRHRLCSAMPSGSAGGN